ncbi:DUF4149 domain-containing protein [Roseisolibacter sp. H3M3-2]|uniref:DUF4149 domain-containing protein n=1 Tax=Roseisolibacter sp. H3M3-2 TaxID=3031323 RepID=UPI0023DCA214|nr:DUF4149 domain-containing protein [Roseisolibacter sp. H3M3-2]MDF1502975.1 DUF4149 domain-containing protein [Roseisolibacter sp. H3M3-2]
MTTLVMPGRLLGAAALLAAWIGAAALVAAVVAPSAFAVLPTRALADALLGRVLPVVFVAGLLVGLGAAALGWYAAPAFARTRLVLPIVAAALCAGAQFGVGPRIQRVRAQIGPSVEALAPTDPLRREFGRLHGVSVALMGAGMLAAGAALVLTGVAATRGR